MILRTEAEIIKCWLPNTKTLVTIVCTTYNHEKYIEDAIKGFLIQETSFPFEIIIHDDASTDGTVEIINEYTGEYPHLITTLFETENQYSRGSGHNIIDRIIKPIIRGKYVALCEGDDYWTDPFKLQKQVDFLEANPDYSLCVGGFTRLVVNTHTTSITIKRLKENDPGRNGYSFSLDEMRKDWITKTLTAVFRKDIYDNIDFSNYKYKRDYHIFYHLVKDHKGFYFTENFGVYNVHDGGIFSMQPRKVNINTSYNCYKELYENNKDDFTRVMSLHLTLALLNFNIYNKNTGSSYVKNLKLYFEAILLSRTWNDFRLLFTVFVSLNIKDKIKKRR